MKIKTNYYCLVDSNNKPDFRFIFTNKADAQRKCRQIKNSLTGETLFVSKQKRDFFVDGIKRNFIDKAKSIDIKKGCWTTLKTKKVSMLDTMKPEVYFNEIIKKPEYLELSNSISNSKEVPSLNSSPISALTIDPTKTTHTVTNNELNTNEQQSLSQNASSKDNNFDSRFSSTFFTESTKEIKETANEDSSLKNYTYPEKIKSNNLKNKTLSSLPLFNTISSLNIFNNYPLLKTNLFAINFAIIAILCITTVFYTNVSANKKIASTLSTEQHQLASSQSTSKNKIAVLGAMDAKDIDTNTNKKNAESDNIDSMVFDTLMKFEKVRSDQLEESIKKMVAGTPMEKMAPYIAKKDKIVAAFLVGISKKESNYGRRVPVLNGKDCYNYWGYRGIRKRMGSGGHTCFDSPEDAIETVGGRIERLVKSGVDTPEEMVLWKCGSDCNATGGWPAAHKWIRDVNMYYTKLLDTAKTDEQSSEKIQILNEAIPS